MIDVSKDIHDGKLQPIIDSQVIELLMGMHVACFYNVSRYCNSNISMDFEEISAVDYTDILQKEGWKHIVDRLIENKSQYDEYELNYFALRNLIIFSWKLDVRFWLHLRQCAEACVNWGIIIRGLAKEKKLTLQPYWLRNTQMMVLSCMNEEMRDQFGTVELAFVKSNKISPKCASLKDTYFICFDQGIYTYLFEWGKLILSGYRLTKFSEQNETVQVKLPIKTMASFMMSVVEIIHGQKSAFTLPDVIMNYSPNDSIIAKDIATKQVMFMLGHEYGHIWAAKKVRFLEEKEEELYADDFAVQLLKKDESKVEWLNRLNNDSSVNDVQKQPIFARALEDVELLFLFFDLYYKALIILGYEEESDESHPHIVKRREAVRKYYPQETQMQLLDFAESLVEQIIEQVKKEKT